MGLPGLVLVMSSLSSLASMLFGSPSCLYSLGIKTFFRPTYQHLGVGKRRFRRVEPLLVVSPGRAAGCAAVGVVIAQRRPGQANAGSAAGHDQAVHRLAQVALQLLHVAAPLLGIAL